MSDVYAGQTALRGRLRGGNRWSGLVLDERRVALALPDDASMSVRIFARH
jgi:hypothetical protein